MSMTRRGFLGLSATLVGAAAMPSLLKVDADELSFAPARAKWEYDILPERRYVLYVNGRKDMYHSMRGSDFGRNVAKGIRLHKDGTLSKDWFDSMGSGRHLYEEIWYDKNWNVHSRRVVITREWLERFWDEHKNDPEEMWENRRQEALGKFFMTKKGEKDVR